MIYKLRIILDTEEDVIREIAILKDNSLEDLHYAITNAFGFDGSEMASFFTTDNNWNQGEEIPLFDMSENGDALTMQHILLSEIIDEEKSKLIYVYDFFSMWSFFVELVDIIEGYKENELPLLLLSLGIVPDKAPEKEFKSDPIDDSSDHSSNNFNIDEFDFDNFDDMMN
ncbi:MAG: hypothetical protein HKN90_01105 [Flavobacteriaceae bacterium]|nr:hypothetical protein [Flavobacteriaceae bacterium]